MKPWVLAAVLIALLAGGALLWLRAERQHETGWAQAGSASGPVAMPGPDVRVSPAGVVQGPATFTDRGAVRPGETEAPAAAGRLPVEGAGGGTVDWEAIPLDRAGGESLGDIETRRAFSAAMRQEFPVSRCTDAWEAPPGIRRLDVELELRVRSVDDALVVEDARILEANVSDASVERCMVEGLRGRRAPAPGIRPGQAYRIKWGASKTLR